MPISRPLTGAPTSFPLTYSAGGVIVAPPGTLFSFNAPAFGYTRSSFDERSGLSTTAAILPTMSPSAISSGARFVESFPAYIYGEVSYVRRILGGYDLGVRAIAQFSTPGLFPAPAPTGPVDTTQRFMQMMEQHREASQHGAAPTPPNFGVTVFGTFY
jgi:hypothetical protein